LVFSRGPSFQTPSFRRSFHRHRRLDGSPAQRGDREWKQLIDRHNKPVREALTIWRGQENDTAGDSFYVTFDGPARAIHCAKEIQQRLRDLRL